MRNKHFKEILKGFSVAIFYRITGIIFSYFFIFLLSRQFGAEAVGIFSLCFTLLQIMTIFSKFGMDSVLLRLSTESIAQKNLEYFKYIFRKIIVLSIIISGLITLISLYLSSFISITIFNKSYLSNYFIIIFLGIPPLTVLFLIRETLRGFDKIKYYVFLQNISIYLFAIILIIIFIILGIKNTYVVILSFVLGIYLSVFIGFCKIKNLFNYQKDKIKINNNLNLKNFKSILKFSIPFLIANSLMLIMNWTDIIMLGIFRTEKEVGIYNVVLKISMVLLIPLMGVATISTPKISKSFWENDIVTFKYIIKKSYKLLFIVSTPIFLALIIFPKLILSLYGDVFQKEYWALIILSWGQFIIVIGGLSTEVLKITGRQKIFQNITIFATILNIILNYILIPKYGIYGASIATTFSLTILSSLSLYLLKKYYL